MKVKDLALGAALIALCSCAGNQPVIERSFGEAEGAKSIIAGVDADAKVLSAADAKLDSAKALKESGSDAEAITVARQSALEYRLAIAVAERDSLKKMDERLEKDLKDDEKRKDQYQEVLNNEGGR